MKRAAGIVVLLLLPLLAACGRQSAAPEEFTIVTSFYPLYIMAKNIARDIPGVRVVNLTASSTGCLHDYQLTPDDMRTLTDAAVVILNGSGMEHFLDQLPQRDIAWRIIDASQHQGLIVGQPSQPYIRFSPSARSNVSNTYQVSGYSTPWWFDRIPDTAYDLAGDKPIGNDTLIVIPPHSPEVKYPPGTLMLSSNQQWEDTQTIIICNGSVTCLNNGGLPEVSYPDPHQWVSIGGHRLQLNTLTDSLCAFDTAHATAYHANAAAYDQRLATLQARLYNVAGDTPAHGIIALHGTLNWFLSELGLADATFALNFVEDGPNAWEMQAIIARIRREQITHLIIDQPFPRRMAETIARETGVKIHVIDPVVTGPDDPEAYLKAMEHNIAVLQEALR